jgi:hypothetical protein
MDKNVVESLDFERKEKGLRCPLWYHVAELSFIMLKYGM